MNNDMVANATEALMQKETVRRDKKSWNVYLMVPEDMEQVSEFLVFRDRESGEHYQLTDEGAVITEKIADLCGVKAGDTLILEDEKLGAIEVPIAAVTENYLSHYIYMTPAVPFPCLSRPAAPARPRHSPERHRGRCGAYRRRPAAAAPRRPLPSWPPPASEWRILRRKARQ